jgi:hypothetical protein
MSEHSHEHGELTIHIDRHQFKVEEAALTGAQLRNLPTPPVGPDYDLYLEMPGGEDELIADERSVELKNGMHFFSVQRQITPGS